MIYYIGAFFVGFGVLLIAGGVIWGLVEAADRLSQFLSRRFNCYILEYDILVGIPIAIIACTVLGADILKHFK